MKIGFIDYFLDEWHANNYPDWIKQASAGDMEVTCAYAMIDSPNGGRSTAQWCKDMGVTHCATIEDVIALSDAMVVLSPDHAERHERLCQLPLQSGKPTYVDKTFAPDGETARRIFALAEKSGTPCYSTSALRYASELAVLGRKAITAISSWGPGTLETYAIHQLEPVMILMQAAASEVQYVAAEGWYTLLVSFADGRYANFSGFRESSSFMLNVCTGNENQMIPIESDYFQPFIMDMVQFFRTRHEPVPHEQTLRIMDVLGAAIKAAKTPGRWIKV